MQDYEYLLSNLSLIKGIGNKTLDKFRKKNVLNIFDLLWHLPTSKIEISNALSVKDLQVGKNQTINVIPIKYYFPRNL